ncbi:MAG: patatin-like phospholipase family protein [Acidimicrobiales bacterium]|nr:MAG: patatin-like phospholipase family protein [Acidimicrobiales bacterium]
MGSSPSSDPLGTVAFVLGGGGLRGAAEVGMVKALAEAEIHPDMVVGTSIGSINGAIIASGPLDQMALKLVGMWEELTQSGVLREGAFSRMANVVRHRTHLHTNHSMRKLLIDWLPCSTFEELEVPFQCSAACVETSSEWWFDSGSLIDALLSSCAVPGLLPPVEVDGRHFIDGGVVNSIPISRALELGATTIYVLHVGNIDAPLRVPRNAWDVAFVAFEISRRHRFHRDMENLPEGVTIHVLPTGLDPHAKFNDPSKLRYNHSRSITRGIERAYVESAEYLRNVTPA